MGLEFWCLMSLSTIFQLYRGGQFWPWLYGSWIYNYLCNQCLSPLKLWVWIPLKARCTWYIIMWSSIMEIEILLLSNMTSVNCHVIIFLLLLVICYIIFWVYLLMFWYRAVVWINVILTLKLEKKYAPALDNYEQSCFVRSDFLKMKCVCKTQMMPPPDHKKL
jgi:hypothetical protein